MLDRGSDAIKPGALIGLVWRRERRAGQLLGIEPVLHPLRRIAPDWERAGERLAFEGVAEARHIAGNKTRKAGPCFKPRCILNVHGDAPELGNVVRAVCSPDRALAKSGMAPREMSPPLSSLTLSTTRGGKSPGCRCAPSWLRGSRSPIHGC